MSKFLIIDKAKNVLEFHTEANSYDTVNKIISDNLCKVKHYSTKRDLFKSISEFLKK